MASRRRNAPTITQQRRINRHWPRSGSPSPAFRLWPRSPVRHKYTRASYASARPLAVPCGLACARLIDMLTADFEADDAVAACDNDRDGDPRGQAAPPGPDPSVIRDAALLGAADRAARLSPAGLAVPSLTSSRLRLSRRGLIAGLLGATVVPRVGRAASEPRLTVWVRSTCTLRLRAAGRTLPART